MATWGFYVCKMIGNGSEDDPYRPYIAGFPLAWSMVGQTGKGCLVFAINPTSDLDNDPQITPVKRDLSATFARNEWNQFINKLKDFGLNANDYDQNRTVREAIIWIGKQWEPMFDIDDYIHNAELMP